ncbi:unnamed protein product [Prorocentrum cordatum]|uniref:Chloride channel protein n=1 Tax=Prorocentrum cordatum TaxID=2364126 RepID=A0ABN9PSE9_9DINO|nr:unnamed protein product [Polarella glacialis]
MVIADASMVGWKLRTVQYVYSHAGVAAGALALAAICCAFCAVAVGSVVFAAPICAGSGLPEAKGYFNGSHVPDMFQPINLYVRVFGIVFAVAAGLPIGREGPMVCIGGCLGIGTVHVLAAKYVRNEVQLQDRASSGSFGFIDEERFAHAKRIGCILGGAAGIASAFGAPVGGILYMFEEVTVTSWPSELTFRVFICTMLASLVSRGFLNLAGQDVHRLVLWNEEAISSMRWAWIDVPYFIVLSVVCGLCSAIFTKGMVGTWQLRRWLQGSRVLERYQPYPKLWDALLYTALCALVFGTMPAFFGCEPVPTSSAHGGEGAHHRRLEGGGDAHADSWVPYTCHEGYMSEVATLVLSGAEGAIKQLYSRDEDEHFSLGSLGSVFVGHLYFLLAMGVSGLSIPMGAFVPTMLIGAVAGRFTGEALVGRGTSHPGLYALVGSAAMLSGFTRMTIAIVMLLVEATRDLSAMLPLMLGIFTSQCVSRLVASHDFTDEMVLKKGIAFLDPTLPNVLSGADVTAESLQLRVEELRGTCNEPEELPVQAPLSTVIRALRQDRIAYFPVVADGVCLGPSDSCRARG